MKVNSSQKQLSTNVPGPGQYSLSSFVDCKKRISFHRRSKHAIRDMYPGPNEYNKNYSQIEKKKSISFGKDRKLKSVIEKTVGPGTYSIKSLFDNIVEKYKKRNHKLLLMRKSKSNKNRIICLNLH